MTKDQFHKRLKTGLFLSTNNKNQHFKFSFTEVHIFRDNKYLCDYNLLENEGKLMIEFSNLPFGVSDSEFQNVLFIIENHKIVINENHSFKGNFDVILEEIN